MREMCQSIIVAYVTFVHSARAAIGDTTATVHVKVWYRISDNRVQHSGPGRS